MAREPVLENDIMGILWEAEMPLTPRQVKERLEPHHPVAYTTAMTVLMRLWKKGLLRRQKVGRAYAYVPVVSQAELAAETMEKVLEGVDDRAMALGRFLDQLTPADREELLRRLKIDG
jgi:predicted transcriptional regulator